MKKKYIGTTVLIPAMDETYSLIRTVDIILETVKPSDVTEIILLLCDRTTAESRRTAESLVDKYQKKVSVFIHDQEMPFVGGAIREGIALAKGTHIIMMSSDLETDPYLVQTFIAYAKRYPARIITASRWAAGGGFSGYNKIKLICNYIFEKMIAFLFFTRLSDLTYAYRIFPANIMKRIKWEELKHPFFLETALKPLRLGVKFIEIPAIWRARTEGESQNSFLANFMYFKTAWHNKWLGKKQMECLTF